MTDAASRVIHALLTGNAALMALTGGRIYGLYAPDGTLPPYVVHEVDSVLVDYDMDMMNASTALAECIVSVLCAAPTYAQLKSMVGNVINAAKRADATIASVHLLESTVERIDDENYDPIVGVATQRVAVRLLIEATS